MTETVVRPITPSRRIAAELRAECARQGVSLRALADALNESHPWVTRRIGVKGDHMAITFEDLERMTDALGVTPADIIYAARWLPRLDSNQQPSGHGSVQVSGSDVPLLDGSGVAA